MADPTSHPDGRAADRPPHGAASAPPPRLPTVQVIGEPSPSSSSSNPTPLDPTAQHDGDSVALTESDELPEASRDGGVDVSSVSGQGQDAAESYASEGESFDEEGSSIQLHAPILGPMEFVVLLPMVCMIRDIYDTVVGRYQKGIDAFLGDGHNDPAVSRQIDELVRELLHLCDYEDLNMPASTKNDARSVAKWAENCSTKCQFLCGLLEALREHDKRITILAEPGKMLDILESILVFYEYNYDRVGNLSPEIAPAKGALRVSLLPTGNDGLPRRVDHADLVIAFDASFRKSEVYSAIARSNPESLDEPSPLILLVISHSVEHLQLCLPPANSEKEKTAHLVACIEQTYPDVGRTDLQPDQAGKDVAEWFLGDPRDPLLWPLPSAEAPAGIELSTNLPPELEDEPPASPEPATEEEAGDRSMHPKIGLKRPLDTENAEPVEDATSKKPRISPPMKPEQLPPDHPMELTEQPQAFPTESSRGPAAQIDYPMELGPAAEDKPAPFEQKSELPAFHTSEPTSDHAVIQPDESLGGVAAIHTADESHIVPEQNVEPPVDSVATQPIEQILEQALEPSFQITQSLDQSLVAPAQALEPSSEQALTQPFPFRETTEQPPIPAFVQPLEHHPVSTVETFMQAAHQSTEHPNTGNIGDMFQTDMNVAAISQMSDAPSLAVASDLPPLTFDVEAVSTVPEALISHVAVEEKPHEQMQELVKRLAEYETYFRRIAFKFDETRSDINNLAKADAEQKAEVASLARRLTSRTAEADDFKERHRNILAELESARAQLIQHNNPGVVAHAQLAEEVRTLKAENEKLKKSIATVNKDFEFTRVEYQRASSRAYELGAENAKLSTQVEDLQRADGANRILLAERNREADRTEDLARIDELLAVIDEREQEIVKLRSRMNGRRETRGPSAPRSPMLGTMSPRQAFVAATVGRSRGNSPITTSDTSSMQFSHSRDGSGRWSHLTD